MKIQDKKKLEIGARIDSAIKAKKLDQTSLAGLLDVTPQAVQQWVSGLTSPKGMRLLSLADHLDVSVSWILTGEEENTRKLKNETKLKPLVDASVGRIAVNHVNFRLQAGISGYEVDYLDDEHEPIFFRESWFQRNGYKPEKLFVLTVQGESMLPKINSGDVVIINTEQTTPKDGVVFAVNYEGQLVIKRMIRNAGQWWLSSDNPDKTRFPDKVCAGDGCMMIGECVYQQTSVL